MKLGVNIDHIASLRQLRKSTQPDILTAAKIVKKAKADSIVVHLREDRRHIQERDLEVLRNEIKVKLNLEMSAAKEIVDVAVHLKPDQATLVPEKRKELTTEGGLDVIKNKNKVALAVKRLKAAGIKVSLFIDPRRSQIVASKVLGVEAVELHTGGYANSKNVRIRKKYLKDFKTACLIAKKLGLTVNAGHGLDYDNVLEIAKIKEIVELNIGYSIICRSVFSGLYSAVKEMKTLIKRK